MLCLLFNATGVTGGYYHHIHGTLLACHCQIMTPQEYTTHHCNKSPEGPYGLDSQFVIQSPIFLRTSYYLLQYKCIVLLNSCLIL